MISIYLSMLETDEEKHQFEQLYTDYKFLMLHVAYQQTDNSDWAEDIVHEAFINVIKNFQTLRLENETEVKALLAIITKNCAINYFKKNSRYTLADDNMDAVYFQNKHNKYENEAVNIIETEECIEFIKTMDTKYSHPLMLKAFGYSIDEISGLLNLENATVKTRIHRARKLLRQKVGSHE